MRLIFSPEYSGTVYARAKDGSDVMMDTVIVNTFGLVDMLELRLGIHYEDFAPNERLARYYDAVCRYMAEDPANVMAASFRNSGLGTAKAMLAWRDGLRSLGWDFGGAALSPRINALIEVEKHFRKEVNHDLPGRIQGVTKQVTLQKLDCSDMHMQMAIAKELLQPSVQELLGVLESNGATLTELPAASENDTNLSKVRNLIAGNQKGKIRLDPDDHSILIYKFRDDKSACEYLAFNDMDDVDLWINSDNKQMDDWMRLMGRPLTGSDITDCSPRIIQLFLIGLSLFSNPLNVNVLLEWLDMPVHPLGRRFRTALSRAVVKNGGYRNDACREIVSKYIEEDHGKNASLVDIFLPPMESRKDILVSDVRNFVAELASWAREYARISDNTQWCEQLHTVAGMCGTFNILLDTVSGSTIEFRTIDSWMSTIYHRNRFSNSQPEIGCRIVVDSPADIASVAGKTVWVGVDGDPGNRSDCAFLYPSERKGLVESCHIIPRGEKAENDYNERLVRNPLFMTENQLILVVRERVAGEPVLKHPLVVRLEQQIENFEDIVVWPKIEEKDMHDCEMIENGGVSAELEFDHADKIKWPDHLSPTNISVLVEHPFDYLMEHLLYIVPDGKSQMSMVSTTKGNVAHSVIEHLFNPRDGHKYAEPHEIKTRIDSEFEKVYVDSLESTGAILQLTENKFAEKLLHEQLYNCLEGLLEILRDNKLKVTGCEKYVERDGVIGYIDMTLEDINGTPVVFDFKWTARAKNYQDILQQNKSVQLELYRWMFGHNEGKNVEKVAYFLMPDCRLYSKEDFVGKRCVKITPENSDDIVAQLLKSIDYRKKQLNGGVVETNGAFSELQYVKDTVGKGLFPLTEEEGLKKGNFFSKYSTFNK